VGDNEPTRRGGGERGGDRTVSPRGLSFMRTRWKARRRRDRLRVSADLDRQDRPIVITQIAAS
jgi:hypothetical protein